MIAESLHQLEYARFQRKKAHVNVKAKKPCSWQLDHDYQLEKYTLDSPLTAKGRQCDPRKHPRTLCLALQANLLREFIDHRVHRSAVVRLNHEFDGLPSYHNEYPTCRGTVRGHCMIVYSTGTYVRVARRQHQHVIVISAGTDDGGNSKACCETIRGSRVLAWYCPWSISSSSASSAPIELSAIAIRVYEVVSMIVGAGLEAEAELLAPLCYFQAVRMQYVIDRGRSTL
ncbi:hypothetical protein F4604DRAFT_1680357 [Suillus subluteus]|nr:hypothetical protein F4604DRAFT_1680357 [Suillus subluteus]